MTHCVFWPRQWRRQFIESTNFMFFLKIWTSFDVQFVKALVSILLHTWIHVVCTSSTQLNQVPTQVCGYNQPQKKEKKKRNPVLRVWQTQILHFVLGLFVCLFVFADFLKRFLLGPIVFIFVFVCIWGAICHKKKKNTGKYYLEGPF